MFKVEKSMFKNSLVIQIWQVDENNKKKSEYPLISFGKKKAHAIIENLEEIKKILEEEN